MKNIISFIMFLCIVICACEKENQNNKEVTVQEESTQKIETVEPVFMESESDEFHPASEFESIRKKKLTNFGTLKTPPPVYTPDLNTAWEVMNVEGLPSYSLESINSSLPWRPKYPFDYENDLDALKRLYDSHNLDNVVKDLSDGLEIMKALMVYTYNFMEGGTLPTPQNDIGPSAEVITQLRRENGTGGTSKHYSALFCQLALSCGFNARIIGMHTIDTDGIMLTNNICEVFLDEYKKWVAFDIYNRCTYYVMDKSPQSAMDIHILTNNNYYGTLNTFSQIGDFSDIISVREKLLPVYKYIYMWRMNDILSKSPRGGSIPWQALYQTHLVWEDEKATVAEGRFDELEQFNDSENPDYPLEGVKYVTRDKDQFNWKLNTVDIHLERVADKKIRVYLDTLTPNFKDFFIAPSQNSTRISTNIYDFIDFLGDNFFQSSNKFNRAGRFSKLSIAP